MSTTTTLLKETLYKLWVFSPVLFPTIIVYLIDIPVFLKVWIAAQHAPRPTNEVPNLPRSIIEKLRLFSPPFPALLESFVLTAFLGVVGILDIVIKGESTAKKMSIFGILVVPGTYCITRLPLRPITLRIARIRSGEPFFIYLNQETTWIVKLFETIIASGICTTALINGPSTIAQRICMAILYGSFLHIIVLGSVVSNTKQKELTLKFRCSYATLLGLTISLLIIVMMYLKPEQGSEHTDGKKPRWLERVFSFTWASLLIEFVGLCYKMDFGFALESGKVGAPVFRQPADTNKMDTSKSVTSGEQHVYVIRVLPSFRAVFDKPYYHVALASFVISVISFASVLTVCELNGRSFKETDYEMFSYYLNIAVSPIVCASVMICACRKGQFWKVWGYGERWMDIPERIPVIQPEDSDAVSGLEICENEKDVEGKAEV